MPKKVYMVLKKRQTVSDALEDLSVVIRQFKGCSIIGRGKRKDGELQGINLTINYHEQVRTFQVPNKLTTITLVNFVMRALTEMSERRFWIKYLGIGNAGELLIWQIFAMTQREEPLDMVDDSGYDYTFDEAEVD